jgi:CRISPR-associated protein Csx10
MKRLDLTITAQSPLAIGRQKPGGSISTVENYIPGSVVRGAIASLMLRQAQQNDTDFAAEPDSDFRALFIEGKALFLNAYPALAEIGDVLQVQPEVEVLPATALSAKNGGGFKPKNGVFDALIDRFCAEEYGKIYDPNCPKDEDGGRVDPFKGFYSRDRQGRYHSHSTSTRLLTRVGINRRRATAEEKILYSIEVLEESKRHTSTSGIPQVEPMVFAGSILVQDEFAETLYGYIQACSSEFRLGNSASRGLGRVKIEAEIQDIQATVNSRVNVFNQALERRWNLWKLFDSRKSCPAAQRLFFTLDLQSDAILTEQWRRTTVISETMLHSRLQALLEFAGSAVKLNGDLNLHAAYSSYDYRAGWNAAWGLMKEIELTTDRGSVYLFSIDREHHKAWLKALELLEIWGIGDRTSEGFGQIKVCDEFHCVFREESA